MMDHNYHLLEPYDIFHLYMDDVTFKMIQRFTNQAIAEEGGQQRLVTLAEMYMFFALEVAHARHPQRREHLYWEYMKEKPLTMDGKGVTLASTGSFAGPELTQFGMSENRFKFIQQHLRLADYSQGKSRAPTGARAWKSFDVLDHLNRRCRDVVGGRCGQWLSMDEAMVPFTGRASFKKKLPKPISEGVKLWMVVDHATCLVLGFQPDDGRHGADLHGNEPWGATGAAVLDMVEPWRGSLACVITDKEYTSPALARELLNRGLYFIGTVNKTRIPKELSKGFFKHHSGFIKVRAGADGGKAVKRTGFLQRGDYIIYKHADLDMYFVLIRDTGKVMLLDTMLGFKHQVLVRKIKHHGGQTVELVGPAAWAMHNAYKGGVDQSDQVRCNLSNGRAMHGRARKWPLRMAHGGVLDLATTNAYHMLKFISKMEGRDAMPMEDVMAAVEVGLMKAAYALDADDVEDRGRLAPNDMSAKRVDISSTPEIFQRFDEWMEGHNYVPIDGCRQTRDGVDSTRRPRARCAFPHCHCEKKESSVTHHTYHESRSVGHECSTCAIPLHFDCFLKHHRKLFLRHISN